jgi:hypothetical protein
MNSSDDDHLLAERLPRMQIIQGAIVAGAIIYAIVAFALRAGGVMQARAQPLRAGGVIQARAQPPILSYICSALALMSLIQWPVVSRMVAKENRKKIMIVARPAASAEMKSGNDKAMLLAAYQTQMIMVAAILEGATFALIISYIIDGTSWTLVGALVLSGVNALRFPTRSRVERWLGEQLELMEQERAGVA